MPPDAEDPINSMSEHLLIAIHRRARRYALRMLEGFKPESIDMLTAKVVEGGALYDNPRPIEPVGVSTMLMDAYLGRRPTAGNTRSLDYIAGAQGPHAAMSATLGGCPIESADACLVCVHGRFSSSDRMIFMMQSALGSCVFPRAFCEEFFLRSHYCPFCPPRHPVNSTFLSLALS